MSGTKLVVIWGYDCATTMQYFMYKDPPRAKIFKKVLWVYFFESPSRKQYKIDNVIINTNRKSYAAYQTEQLWKTLSDFQCHLNNCNICQKQYFLETFYMPQLFIFI